MKLKTVEVDGKVYAEVVGDGALTVIDDKGEESSFDVARSTARIRELNRESQRHRETKEAAEERLRAFEGIENPDEAREALEFRRNAKDGEFVAAGKVEEIKAGLKRTFDEQNAATARANAQKVQDLEGKLNDVTGKYNGEVVGNAFANSKFIREKVATPLGMVRATFGNQFKIEDGKLIGYHTDGSPIMSASGDPAPFDEAMERIVGAYPDKDMILKGSGSSGSGARPSNGTAAGKKTISRSEYDLKPPPEQARIGLQVGRGELAIVD